jgi:hypothetical protein
MKFFNNLNVHSLNTASRETASSFHLVCFVLGTSKRKLFMFKSQPVSGDDTYLQLYLCISAEPERTTRIDLQFTASGHDVLNDIPLNSYHVSLLENLPSTLTLLFTVLVYSVCFYLLTNRFTIYISIWQLHYDETVRNFYINALDYIYERILFLAVVLIFLMQVKLIYI